MSSKMNKNICLLVEKNSVIDYVMSKEDFIMEKRKRVKSELNQLAFSTAGVNFINIFTRAFFANILAQKNYKAKYY